MGRPCTLLPWVALAICLACPPSRALPNASPALTNIGQVSNVDSLFAGSPFGAEQSNPQSTTGPVIPNQYLVQLKPGADAEAHKQWLNQHMASQNMRLRRRDGTAGITSSLQNTFQFQFPDNGASSSAAPAASSFYYSGTFSPELVQLLRSNPDVQMVEQDRSVNLVAQASGEGDLADGFNSTASSSSDASLEQLAAANSKYSNDATSYNFTHPEPNLPRTNEKSQQTRNWGLDRIDQRYLPLDGTFNYVVNGGANVDVFVLDSGVNAQHQDFGGRAQNVYCVGQQPCTDDNGHGTHVAGIIASTTYGVGKGIQIQAVKVLDTNGRASGIDIMQGLQYISSAVYQRRGARKCVINISAGGTHAFPIIQQALTSLVLQLDCVVVVAAGNSDENACNTSPGDPNYLVTVGNTDQNDVKYSESSWGPCVTILAPGTGIRSLWNASATATALMTGTSMAAPFVTGVVAVHRGMFPQQTALEVIELLKQSGTKRIIDGLQLPWFFRAFPWNWGRSETYNNLLYSRLYEVDDAY